MSEPREPLRSVAVVGSGPVGILTAIAIRRAVPSAQVTVFATEHDPLAFADNAATALPFTNTLHDRLGIDEMQLVREAGASHRLGLRYIGWSADRSRSLFVHGAQSGADSSAFQRDWGGGSKNAIATNAPESLAEVLIDAKRFAVPPPDRETPLSSVDYALRWNPAAYRDVLIAIAGQCGIVYRPEPVTTLQVGARDVAALVLASGEVVGADLLIDCGGSRGALIAQMPGYTRHDWSAILPIRAVAVASRGQPMVALEDRISLTRFGWIFECAGRDGLQTICGVAAETNEETVAEVLRGNLAAILPLSQGCARENWIGNVVALGDAAAHFEPLANLNLDLAHRQLDLLLELLPGRDAHPLERREFNRRSSLMNDAVRDTLALHYASPLAGPIFGASDPPDAVRHLADQFGRNGRIPFREETPFLPQETTTLLRALGFAQGLSPQSRNIPESDIVRRQQAFDRQAMAAVNFAPPYADWLASL